MLPDSLTTQERHQQFIQQVVASNTVWGLSGEEGWAVSSSHHDENIDIILFWSDEEGAKAVAKEDWSNYAPVPIPLAEFLENWLVGMHQNQVMAGTNWNANLFGEEIAALKLIMEMIEAAKAAGAQLAFTKYADLADFETEVRQALENAGSQSLMDS
jgi:hypothetical protein